jgi:Tfp pilus assembly protein PilX
MEHRRMKQSSCPPRRRSAGFSLITAVVMVLMAAIVGIAAMTASRSQLMAASNAQYQVTALQEAERAVATAESWLLAGTNAKGDGFTTYSAQTTPALYPKDYLANNNLNPLTWTWSDTNSVALNNGVSRYVIEQVATNLMPLGESQRGLVDDEGNTDCKRVNVFRISARGTSGAGASRTLQTVFSVDGC